MGGVRMSYITHAAGSLEDVVKAAIDRGFDVFGLTEHVPRYRTEDLYPEEVEITPSDLLRTFDEFILEAHRLKALYSTQITLLVGLETDYITDNDLDQLEILIARHGDRIEYVVGSVHHCNGIPIDFDKPTFERAVASFADSSAIEIDDSNPGQAQIAFLNEYLDAQLRLMQRISPEVIGHFDLCRLYTPNLSFESVWQKVERNIQFLSFTSHRPAAGVAISKLVPAPLRADPNQAANLRQLFALAKPEKTTLLTAFGLLLISSSVTMSVPLTFGKLIDFFSHGAQPGTLPISVTPATAGVVLLALFTLGAAANAGRVILMRSASARIVARLRKATYSSALRQDIEFLERSAGPGDVVSRLNADTYIVGDSLTGNLSDGVRAIVTASIGLSLMFYLSPTLTALMLAIVPPVSLGAFAYGRYLKRLSNRTQEGLGDMTKVANEALSAVRTVQAFTAAPREEARFAAKVEHVQDLAIKEARAAAMFFGATGWSGNVVVLGLLAYVSRGQISVGDLTSLLMYTAYVGGSLSMLSSFFSSLMKGLGASERVFQLLGRKPEIRGDSGTVFDIARDYGNIEFKNVSFAYPSRPGAEILRGFSMKIEGKGDSVAIVGKSGSGKSSVQSLLFRFYDPHSGKILVNGKEIHNYSVESWRSAIAIVPQVGVVSLSENLI
ncbi:putative ABC transporter ATP-binding protein/permease C9B6,09c [Rhizoctonia solani AG-1 IB]|uniref:histidinol-phosphatase n=1 Tax=Thanatephorus cucumeris (strain AG1-IB / isolate 7/3/14) TaxID=1108050 RepID=M5C486_THACB|nr:putative ABC transporter ATP-binding protein/permease C9B6,09c [Rhizoctonia solani AG-1 IB]